MGLAGVVLRSSNGTDLLPYVEALLWMILGTFIFVLTLYFMIDYRNYIEIDPNKRFGKPCIKGTRVSVYDVLNWLANDMSIVEIVDEFPELSKEMIQACLLYASDREQKLRTVA